MKKAIRFISAMFAAAVVFLAGAVTDNGGRAISVFAEDGVLTLKAEKTTLTIGGTTSTEITAELPAGVSAGSAVYTWTSSSSKVSISGGTGNKRTVSAVGLGEADISASVTAGGKKYKGKVTIKVEPGVPDVTTNISTVTTTIDGTDTLYISMVPNGNAEVTFKAGSADEKIASAEYYEENGDRRIIIKGKKIGLTYVTMTYNYGTPATRFGKQIIPVVVKAAPSSDQNRVTLSTTILLLEKGESAGVTATLPEGALLMGTYSWKTDASDSLELIPLEGGDIVNIKASENAKPGIYSVVLTVSYMEKGGGALHSDVTSAVSVTVPSHEPPPPLPDVEIPVVDAGPAPDSNVSVTLPGSVENDNLSAILKKPITNTKDAEAAVNKLKTGSVTLSGAAASNGITANMSKHIYKEANIRIKVEASSYKYTVKGNALTSKKAAIKINPKVTVSKAKDAASIKLNGKMSGIKSLPVQFRVKSLSGKKVGVYAGGKCVKKTTVSSAGWFYADVTPAMMGKSIIIRVIK